MNLFLPSFKKTVFEALNHQTPADNEKLNKLTIKDYTNDLTCWLQDKPSDKPLLDESIQNDYLKDIMASEKQVIENFSSSIVSVFFIYNDLFERASSKKVPHMPCLEELTKISLVTLLKYIEVYGLPNVVNDFSQIYHNLYLSLRLAHLISLDNEQGFNQTNKEGISKRQMLAARVSSYIVSCDELRPTFLSEDIDNKFINVLIDSVDYDYSRASSSYAKLCTRTSSKL